MPLTTAPASGPDPHDPTNSPRCSPGSRRRGAWGADPTDRCSRRSSMRATPCSSPCRGADRCRRARRHARLPRLVGRAAPALAHERGRSCGARSRHRRRPEAPAACGLPRARRRRDAVDLRPADPPQRATQPGAARRRGRLVPARLLRRARRRDHRSRPQRPLRGAVAPRLAAHGASARPRPASRVALRGRPRPRRRLRGRTRRGSRGRELACATPHGRHSRCSVPTPGCASSSMPPATTSSRATTPTGRPDERHERHDQHRRNGDRAHRAAPPRGAAGAAVRDLLRARDGARGAPRARRHRRGRWLGRVRRRSRPVLLGRVRRRRGIRDRALPRSGAARPSRPPCGAAPCGSGCRGRGAGRGTGFARGDRAARGIRGTDPRVRRGPSHGEGRARGGRARRGAARAGPLDGRAVRRDARVGRLRCLGRHRTDPRGAARRGDGLRRGGVPPHQAQDQARLGPRAGRCGPRGARATAGCCRSTRTPRTRPTTSRCSPSSTRSTSC